LVGLEFLFKLKDTTELCSRQEHGANVVKTVSRNRVIYSFNPQHDPAEHVIPGELIMVETEDAFSGQIKSKKDSVKVLDWSRVDGATGPIFVEDARPGDALVVEILEIKVPKKGVIITIPKCGILADKKFRFSSRIVGISRNHVSFESVRVRTNPMVGTIGVTPESGEIPCGSLGKHGGNMDVKEMTAGTKLYLPVFVEGALFALGDVHAVQADGELCVSAVEVPGEILLRFKLIKRKKPQWPILETKDSYAFLACGETLDEAARFAAEAAVEAFIREYNWSFETAYMFGSLAIDLKINQVVDTKKGVRAVVSKDLIDLDNLLV
jgi:amidase